MKRIFSFICIFVLLIIQIQPALASTTTYTYANELVFPAAGQENGTANSTATLTGNGVAINFRTITGSDGNTYVQRQTTVDGQVVDAYTDGLGFLVMYAYSTSAYNWPGPGASSTNYPHFIGKATSSSSSTFNTANVFAGGLPSWVTMNSLSVNGSTVTMTGENDYATVAATWTMESTEKDPKVDVTFTAKKDGSYSFGMFTSPKGYSKDIMKFIQVPFRYTEMGLPEDCYLVSEAYSTSSVSQVTTTTGSVIDNKDVTYGIFVDPTSINNEGDTSALTPRWVVSNSSYYYYNDNGSGGKVDATKAQSNYGLSIRGKDGNVQPGAFAPIMGTADSKFAANGTFKITYRPMATVSEPAISSWYDNYLRVLSDYLKVTDYRNNYYASMTDTIFNMTKLALDDKFGGWSDDGKAHYNMEGRNVVSNGDPLAYMQLYLLTEDETILNERTIPSMEFILSRSNATYNAYGRADGLGNPHGFGSAQHIIDAMMSNSDTLATGYTKIGFNKETGTDGIGNSSYFGAYKMTMGMMPYYQQLAAAGLNGTYISKASQSGVKNPSEYLWQSRALALFDPDTTDDETADKQLYRAKTHAGWYVDRRVNLGYINSAGFNANGDWDFIFKDYYPNIHCLLELYEETKEQKYLTAAKESAHRLIATLWSTYMQDENTNYVIDSDKATYINRMLNGNVANQMWWAGDARFRLGEDGDTWSSTIKQYVPRWNSTAVPQSATTVPAWTVSRVGLGVEQVATFSSNSGNIYMSTWAPDLMRIAYLTGDKMLEAFARNSIVGRYANYPSYYLREYSTYHQQENFPYIGPDTTQIYHHHIPVMISMLQDFLISQSYSWSDGKVDFPSVRSQGYHYYSNRHYGFAPGKVFNETDMWLWMKEGLITVDNKQIDWFGARKDGRAAFIFTNASDETITTNVTFGDEVGMGARVNSVIYTKGATTTTKIIENKVTTVTVPPRATVAVAFSASGVKAPAYSKMYGTNSTDITGKYNEMSVLGTNDVIGHVVQIKPDSYNAYIYTTHRPSSVDDNGLSKAIIRYSIDGASWVGIADTKFPFEFSIPVDDATKSIQYKLELFDKDGNMTKSDIATLNGCATQTEPILITTAGTRGTTLSSTGNPTISGWNTAQNSSINVNGTYNCFAFFKAGQDTGEDLNLTLIYTLYDANNNFKRVAKIVNQKIPAANTSSSLMNLTTIASDPIVLTEADNGCHFVVYIWNSIEGMKPYATGRYNFKTGTLQ